VGAHRGGQAAHRNGCRAGAVARACDLDGVQAQYEQLIIRYSGRRPPPGDPLLLTHIQLVNEWQRFPFLDPQLPEALLPNWIGHRAAVVFTQLRGAVVRGRSGPMAGVCAGDCPGLNRPGAGGDPPPENVERLVEQPGGGGDCGPLGRPLALGEASRERAVWLVAAQPVGSVECG
jgi:PaaX-like protein C-terminal domain